MTCSAKPIPRLSPDALVNDVLRDHPATARVFNAFAIDACCGGARTLRDAAREDGADCCTLLAELEWVLAESEDEA
jgi:regulator of cell morphogenesis and NO signaling